MALLLHEDEIAPLVTMPAVIDEVEAVSAALADGRAFQEPRNRLRMPGTMLHMLSAAWPERGYYALKAYSSSPEGIRFRILLYAYPAGRLLAILEGNRLGQLRTGAATAVAARRWAPAEPLRVALFGAGLQAWGQIEALHCTHELTEVRVVSRTPERRERFAERLAQELGLTARAVPDAETALAEANVVVTATTARDPLFPGDHLPRGAFVAAVGANMLIRRELDGKALARIDRLVVDDVETARRESGWLLPALEAGRFHWNQVATLPDLVAGRIPPRLHADETLAFHSLGSASWDLVTAILAYEAAIERSVGQEIPLD